MPANPTGPSSTHSPHAKTRRAGKPAIWDGEIPECAFQNTLIRVRPVEADSRYLLHYFGYCAVSGRFARRSRGVGIFHLGRKALAEWLIPLPPIEEQRRIAAVLDAADALRTKRQRAIAMLDALTQAIFHDMFGDTPTVSGCVPLGEFMPPKKKSIDPRKWPDETFELLSIPAFDAGAPEVVAGRSVGSAKQLLERNDVILSRIVPHIRRAGVVRSDSECRTIGSGEWIIFRSDRFVPAYLRHVLVSDRFHQEFMRTVAGVGGSLLRAQPSRVAEIEVPLPRLDEQLEFGQKLGSVSAMREQLRGSLDVIGVLFASLQQRAFRGEL